jgi:hypothetical protein
MDAFRPSHRRFLLDRALRSDRVAPAAAGSHPPLQRRLGTPNTDSGGYHDTITMVFLAATARFRFLLPPGTPGRAAINLLIEDPFGARDLPLTFYSRDRLMSVAARRGYIDPDLQPIEALDAIGASLVRPRPSN